MTIRPNLHRNKIVMLALAACLLGGLGACDTLDRWLGDESRTEQPLAGERIAVLGYRSALRADESLAGADINQQPARENEEFTSETALQQQGLDNVRISGLERIASVNVGDGNEWDSELMQQPVVGDGILFAKDAAGVISAHDLDDIQRILWKSDTAQSEEQKEMNGGGLAYAGGVLYVTTGHGSVLALVAKDGSLLWRREIGVPIRSAPAASEGQAYAITIDNQLIAFHARTGRQLWTHRGIRESAVYLGTVAPVVRGGIVIASYSSGEIVALRAEDGLPLWSDTLISTSRTSASSVLTGIDATPIIRDNLVYAISNNGLMAAYLLSNGRGLWDLELSASQTPWIAGDYIFVLTTDAQLVAIQRKSRQIKWVSALSEWFDDELPAYISAPMMINSTLLLLTNDGRMLRVDPVSGSLKERGDIPESVRVPPITAQGSLFLLDQDAVLHQYR